MTSFWKAHRFGRTHWVRTHRDAPHSWCVKALLFVSVAVCTGAAQAQGIPVYDAANWAQAIAQVQAWEAQYNQMLQTINQQQQMLQSTSGTRNLGLVANNITSSVLPPNINSLIASATDHAALNQLALQQYGALNQAMQTRSAQIQQLMAQINATNDQKGIQELTARIQAEQVMVANEAKEGEWLRAQIETQARLLDQQLIQKQMDRLH